MKDSWWKEATPTINESYRPWKDNNSTKFWKNMAKIKDDSIVQFLFK
jgi:hypothetical protein